ncbi:MAG: metallophosphoesterase [Niameybacter sp.]|uniref:metallophosphoesterase family protein n=1 Tax=Niameybacter sp. TaxID=2033640 RepID=UPI002FC78AFA
MKILVVSDTHGQTTYVEQLIELFLPYGLTHLIHCGDCIEDAKRIEAVYPLLTVYKVPGNCDFSSYSIENTILAHIEGVPIMITHGHKQHAKSSYEELWIDAEAHEAKIAIFGHTHIAHKETKNGITLLNPGSMTLPKDSTVPSFAMIEIQKGQIKDVALLQMIDKSRVSRRN